MKCKCCGHKLIECYESFVHYFYCEHCHAYFTDRGELFEWN